MSKSSLNLKSKNCPLKVSGLNNEQSEKNYFEGNHFPTEPKEKPNQEGGRFHFDYNNDYSLPRTRKGNVTFPQAPNDNLDKNASDGINIYLADDEFRPADSTAEGVNQRTYFLENSGASKSATTSKQPYKNNAQKPDDYLKSASLESCRVLKNDDLIDDNMREKEQIENKGNETIGIRNDSNNLSAASRPKNASSASNKGESKAQFANKLAINEEGVGLIPGDSELPNNEAN
jgi:hypothetical protein